MLTDKQLSPASFALYSRMPEYIQMQLVSMRDSCGNVDISRVETEKLLAQLCSEELSRRKKAGTYSGSFGPVTHFFGF